MNKITEKILALISSQPEELAAYSLRENGICTQLQSSEHIKISAKKDGSGIDILVDAQANGEKLYLPACITRSSIADLVYNDFHISAGAKLTIIAGCGIHTDSSQDSMHQGMHRFFIQKNAKVRYIEKHIGLGEGTGRRIINPQTYISLEKNSEMQIETAQIQGVSNAKRDTTARLAAGAKLVIRDKIMTQENQTALADFQLSLNGKGASADLISRAVAKGASKQLFRSQIYGNSACSGHSECDAIIMDRAEISAIPELTARHPQAALIHEAAIGKIAGEQIVKLMTLGLTEEQAEAKIIEGFLK